MAATASALRAAAATRLPAHHPLRWPGSGAEAGRVLLAGAPGRAPSPCCTALGEDPDLLAVAARLQLEVLPGVQPLAPLLAAASWAYFERCAPLHMTCVNVLTVELVFALLRRSGRRNGVIARTASPPFMHESRPGISRKWKPGSRPTAWLTTPQDSTTSLGRCAQQGLLPACTGCHQLHGFFLALAHAKRGRPPALTLRIMGRLQPMCFAVRQNSGCLRACRK